MQHLAEIQHLDPSSGTLYILLLGQLTHSTEIVYWLSPTLKDKPLEDRDCVWPIPYYLSQSSTTNNSYLSKYQVAAKVTAI